MTNQNRNGITYHTYGYRLVRVEGSHPRKDSHGYVPEHVLIAEKALGYYLPRKVIVHHVNEDPANNKPKNLVICENQFYHKLLHLRMRALRETGNANNRKCVFCSGWALPETEGFTISFRQSLMPYHAGDAYHKECARLYQLNRRTQTGQTSTREK